MLRDVRGTSGPVKPRLAFPTLRRRSRALSRGYGIQSSPVKLDGRLDERCYAMIAGRAVQSSTVSRSIRFAEPPERSRRATESSSRDERSSQAGRTVGRTALRQLTLQAARYNSDGSGSGILKKRGGVESDTGDLIADRRKS